MYVILISASTPTNETSATTVKARFNFDDEELLITEVQNRPALWDFTLPLKERNVRTKNKLWEEIAQILLGKNKLKRKLRNYVSQEIVHSISIVGKFTATTLKLKFKSLHDTFRKIIQSEHCASGSARKMTTRQWSHYESMQFLRDSCLLRK